MISHLRTQRPLSSRSQNRIHGHADPREVRRGSARQLAKERRCRLTNSIFLLRASSGPSGRAAPSAHFACVGPFVPLRSIITPLSHQCGHRNHPMGHSCPSCPSIASSIVITTRMSQTRRIVPRPSLSLHRFDEPYKNETLLLGSSRVSVSDRLLVFRSLPTYPP